MDLREELLDGGWDGQVIIPTIFYQNRPTGLNSLLVATQYDPLSVLEKLSPYLGGSTSIVVHSPYVQVVFRRTTLSSLASNTNSS